MKRTLFALSLLLLAACSTSHHHKTRAAFLNATWIPLTQEMGGTPLPAAIISRQQLIIRNNRYTVIAESVDKGDFTINGNKMDIYGREGVNAGKHFTAIFKTEIGHLFICYNLAGTGYPETFDTKGQPQFFLSVYKRE